MDWVVGWVELGCCWVGRFLNYWVFRFPTVAVVVVVAAVVTAVAVVEAAAAVAAVNIGADSESPAQPYSYNVPNSFHKIHSWNNSRYLWNRFHCPYRRRRRCQRLEEFLPVATAAAAAVIVVRESLARAPLAG